MSINGSRMDALDVLVVAEEFFLQELVLKQETLLVRAPAINQKENCSLGAPVGEHLRFLEFCGPACWSQKC
jgi:hypothetical protein